MVSIHFQNDFIDFLNQDEKESMHSLISHIYNVYMYLHMHCILFGYFMLIKNISDISKENIHNSKF